MLKFYPYTILTGDTMVEFVIFCVLNMTFFDRLLLKICDWAEYQNRHSSKSIRVTQLSFRQSDSPMSESFWQKNSLVTHIFFIYAYLNILAQSQILGNSL